MAHFAVTGGNGAGVDNVLIQPFLHYCVNQVILMLTRRSQWGEPIGVKRPKIWSIAVKIEKF